MSDSVVDMIREKTESGDLDTILKTTLGGYTKKSVLEYIATLKKQRDMLRSAYEEETAQILEEKNLLQDEKDKLLKEVSSLEEKNRTLEEEKQQLEEEKAQLEEDRRLLENDRAGLADREADGETIRELTLRIEQLTEEKESIRADLKDSEDELAQTRAMLIEKEDALKELRERAEQKAEDDPKEKQVSNSMLFAAIREQLLEQEALIAEKETQIAALTEDKRKLQSMIDHNDALLVENEELSNYLGEAMEKQILLSRELAKEKAMNQVLKKRIAYETI